MSETASFAEHHRFDQIPLPATPQAVGQLLVEMSDHRFPDSDLVERLCDHAGLRAWFGRNRRHPDHRTAIAATYRLYELTAEAADRTLPNLPTRQPVSEMLGRAPRDSAAWLQQTIDDDRYFSWFVGHYRSAAPETAAVMVMTYRLIHQQLQIEAMNELFYTDPKFREHTDD